MQPTHRVRFEYALQSDLLRAIRRHRRTAEDHYTREPKRAEISRLRRLNRRNTELGPQAPCLQQLANNRGVQARRLGFTRQPMLTQPMQLRRRIESSRAVSLLRFADRQSAVLRIRSSALR